VQSFSRLAFFAIILVSSTVPLVCVDKGFCPPLPPAGSFKSSQGSRTPPKAPASDTRFLGVVQVLVEVTDKGYVCDFRVVHALNQDADNQVKEAVRNWHFTPAKKNGRGVPITALVEVDVWRNSKGEIVLQKPADDNPSSATNK
jgi:TonB family protein